jgi:hypothetical protein
MLLEMLLALVDFVLNVCQILVNFVICSFFYSFGQIEYQTTAHYVFFYGKLTSHSSEGMSLTLHYIGNHKPFSRTRIHDF